MPRRALLLHIDGSAASDRFRTMHIPVDLPQVRACLVARHESSRSERLFSIHPVGSMASCGRPAQDQETCDTQQPKLFMKSLLKPSELWSSELPTWRNISYLRCIVYVSQVK